jgi:hypothetical protein
MAAQWTQPFDNRRHTQRVDAEGTGVVHLRDRTMFARIVDLGIGGVRLGLTRAVESESLTGAPVVVELRLDGARSKWLRFGGTVQRVDTSACEIAIAFRTIPTDFEDVVQDELVAALEGDRTPRVLLVDADTHRRSTLARAFSAAGCRVTEVRAPLDALSALDESKSHYTLIAIADTIPELIGEEFRRFVSDTHPELTNLVMRMPRPRAVEPLTR